MRILSSLIILFCLTSSNIHAQEPDIRTNTALGFQLNQYQKDTGMGINITTPYFIYDRVAIRLRVNMMFNESLDQYASIIEYKWYPYFNAQLGLIGVAGFVSPRIKLYGEGGFVFLFPNQDISTVNFEFGGYGHFGFEFYMSNFNSYFIELGGVGTGARADITPGRPIYSNGFLISTGFRFHL